MAEPLKQERRPRSRGDDPVPPTVEGDARQTAGAPARAGDGDGPTSAKEAARAGDGGGGCGNVGACSFVPVRAWVPAARKRTAIRLARRRQLGLGEAAKVFVLVVGWLVVTTNKLLHVKGGF